jgi:phage shock protein A
MNTTQARKLKDLEKDLKVAILKEKDDIARMLIKKITFISRQRKDFEQHRLVLEQKSEKLLERIQEQQAQYNRLKLKAREYLAKEERNRNAPFQSDLSFYAADTEHEPSSEEIELELLKYKERFQTADKGEES